MGSRVQLDPKLANEVRPYTFNFLSKLTTGDSVASAVCSATVYSGNDASPASIISGAASVASPVVTQSITGGVLGTIYDLVCTATTTLGYTLKLVGYLAVVPDLP